MQNILADKISLRKQMYSALKRNCADKNIREFYSKIACDIFLSSDIYNNAEWIFAFCSMPNEIETFPIIERALYDKKRVALPRVAPNTNEMDFYFLDEKREISEQLTAGEFGIREPRAELQKIDVQQIAGHCSKIQRSNLQKVVFLVPCLALDTSGARLGKGKGFYDKYFSRLTDAVCLNEKYSVILASLCFPFQIIERVPSEPHDFRMTHIISDKLFYCGVSAE